MNFTKKLILACFKKFPDIEKVVLFGSRALGNFKPGSDVDLMISGAQVNPSIVTKLFGLLNDEVSVPFKFDLALDNQQLSPELRAHIDQHGVVFYRKN